MSFLHVLENFFSDMHIDDYDAITALSTALSCTFSQARSIIPYLDPFQAHPLSYYLDTYPEAFL